MSAQTAGEFIGAMKKGDTASVTYVMRAGIEYRMDVGCQGLCWIDFTWTGPHGDTLSVKRDFRPDHAAHATAGQTGPHRITIVMHECVGPDECIGFIRCGKPERVDRGEPGAVRGSVNRGQAVGEGGGLRPQPAPLD
jgi:hypothetical protein